MRLRTNMTPVVSTALAIVAAGSLVLFSLVLQDSAFNSSLTQGLRPLSPSGESDGVSVLAPRDVDAGQEAGGGGAGEAGEPTSGAFSPPVIADAGDDSPIASFEGPPDEDDEFPTVGGGTGSTVGNGANGPTIRADGPQATISKDPNGRPGDVNLPDRNGPKNAAPPHDNDDDSEDRDDDSDDDSKDKGKSKDKDDGNDKSKDKGKSKDKDRSKDKDDGNDKSKDEDDEAEDDDSDGDEGRGGGRGDRSDAPDGDEPEDNNDRHDTRRDPDEDEDEDDDEPEPEDESGHSADASQGHSQARGPRR